MTDRFDWFDADDLSRIPLDSELSKRAIRNDRWDREDLERNFKNLPPFSNARKSLADFTPTGGEAVEDAFLRFYKAEPELFEQNEMPPSHVVNRMIAEEMEDLPATERLRKYSIGDDVQAALSAAAITPDLETLFDRAKGASQAGQQYQDALEAAQQAADEATDVDDMVARWGEENPGEATPQDMLEKQAAAQQAAQDAQDAADAAGQALQEEMDKAKGGIAEGVAEAMGKAADEAEAMGESARAFGLTGGELTRLPAQKRIEIAKRLNTPRFRKIADLFGAMKNLLWTEQSRKVVHSNEEIFDVGIGSDLARVLPQEIINLRPGPTRLDFLRRLTEGKLLQYELQGQEKLGKGAIIFIEDGSGSMRGEREMWAKAIMLALLNFAKVQKRAFHLIHFGSQGQMYELDFSKPEDFTFERIVDAAEIFFNGGTEYTGPMGRAIKRLEDEHRQTGKVSADIVFASDGECYVNPGFMEDYLKRMDAVQATTWAISIGQNPSPDGPLMQMTRGKVSTVDKLIKTGEEVRGIFRGI
jgi:uncharacterized protein with von Willebrand factor type A (vWA) domain